MVQLQRFKAHRPQFSPATNCACGGSLVFRHLHALVFGRSPKAPTSASGTPKSAQMCLEHV
eukprot:15454032-Alexandrium_andersonii.AAC.1